MTKTDKTDKSNPVNDLTGHFLIAMPSLDDGFFNQSVTYICEHDESGSFGIIINQESGINLQQVIKEMKIDDGAEYNKEQIVFIGGPVDQGRGFILHRPKGEWLSSLTIKNNVVLTSSKDILQAIANNKGPEDNLVALGYAGWAAGQLEKEIAANTWLNCPADEQIIFNTPVDKRWKAAAKLIGIDLSLISSDTGHA